MNHTPTVNFSDFEDDGISQAVYFILDQSRELPGGRRANIMMQAAALLPLDSAPRRELHAIAQELFECEKVAQEMVGLLRFCNPQVNTNEALNFMLSRMEVADIPTKLELVGNALNMGLESRGGEWSARLHHLWDLTREATAHFDHAFGVFMFRLRNRLWDSAAPVVAA